MRTLSDTLKAAQQAESMTPLIKITLSLAGEDDVVIECDRLRKLNRIEEPYRINAKEAELDNSDGYFTDKDLKGYKAVISWGLLTKVGEEYSDTSPMWVTWQQLNSVPGRLSCLLTMLGIPDLMDEDEASEDYIPDETDTKTVKTLINQIAGATLACYSHCTAYEVVWESGYDTLADTYKPKDSLRIYIGGSRLATIKRLMEYTRNVLRYGADGKIHILKPVTTGTDYDYEHSLESGHTFFSKAYRKSLIIPNRIVVKSQKDDDPQYSGEATSPASYALLPKTKYIRTRLESNAQAKSIAEAVIFNLELRGEAGAAEAPMNCGAELFDYVKVAAFCAEDTYRVGNIGSLTLTCIPEKRIYNMRFSFGDPPVVQHIKELYQSIKKEAESGSLKGVFDTLYAKDGYIENLSIDQINAYWLDPESNIDLDKIGDTIDNLSDGELYARVKSLHLDAGQIKMDEHIYYKAGYDPSTKMPGDADLDDIGNGVVYQRVKSTDIQAGHIKVSSVTLFDGIWYNESGVTIDALEGVTIQGGKLTLQDSGGTHSALLYVDASGYLRIDGWVRTITDHLYPAIDGIYTIGSDAKRYLIMYTKDISIDRYLKMESGSRVRGDLIPYSNSAYNLGSDSRWWDFIYGRHLYIDGNIDATGDVSCDDVNVADKVDCERVVCNLITGPDITSHDVIPTAHQQYYSGFSDKAWYKSYAYGVYSSDGQIHQYQRQDDIALLKAIKGRKEKGKDVIDGRSLPKDLVEINKKGECFVNVAGLAGLNLGIQKSLLAKIEALEAKVETLEVKPQNPLTLA